MYSSMKTESTEVLGRQRAKPETVLLIFTSSRPTSDLS